MLLMKRYKNIFSIVLLMSFLLGFFVTPSLVEAQETAEAEKRYVFFDEADVFSDEEEQKIYSSAVSFLEKYPDTVLFVFSTAEKVKIREYSETKFYDVFPEFDEENMWGLAVVFDMQKPGLYLGTYGRAESFMDYRKSNYITEQMVAAMEEDVYGEGVVAGFREIERYLQIASELRDGKHFTHEEKNEVLRIFIPISFLLILFIIWRNSIRRKRKKQSVDIE